MEDKIAYVARIEKENTELKALVKKMGDAINDSVKEVEWARHTYDEKLKFGMNEEQAIKSRERRYNGVFITFLKRARQLQKSPEYIKHVKGEKSG